MILDSVEFELIFSYRIVRINIKNGGKTRVKTTKSQGKGK